MSEYVKSRIQRLVGWAIEWIVWHLPRDVVELAFWRVWATTVPNEDNRDWEQFTVADVAQLWWFGPDALIGEDANV